MSYFKQSDSIEFLTQPFLVEDFEFQVKVVIIKGAESTEDIDVSNYSGMFEIVQIKNPLTEQLGALSDRFIFGKEDIDSKKLKFLMGLVKYQWILPCT